MNKISLSTLFVGLVSLLLLGGAIYAIVPFLSPGSAGSESSGAAEIEPILLALPAGMTAEQVPAFLLAESGDALAIHPLMGVLLLTAITMVVSLVVGGGLSLLMKRLYRFAAKTTASEEYKTGLETLAKKEKEQIKQLNEAAPQKVSKTTEEIQSPRWSLFSTGAIFLFFVLFLATAISDTLYPEGELTWAGRTVGAKGIVISILLFLTFLIMLLTLRSKTLASINEDVAETAAAIPWDWVYVVVTGFIFVVAGVGLIWWVRTPVG